MRTRIWAHCARHPLLSARWCARWDAPGGAPNASDGLRPTAGLRAPDIADGLSELNRYVSGEVRPPDDT